ncbi:hypothetical protein [Tenacibaculum maritimum]|uniref:hypothetical protein n=5 Tax=Tenacibaculum maritimum TaxID=107401 RepID=UPI003876CDD0
MNKLLYVVFFFLFSCAGFNDTIDDLGEGFYFKNEGTGSNYIFWGKKNKKGVLPIEKILVLSDIVGYFIEDNYIIIKQKPNIRGIKYHLLYLDEEYNYLNKNSNSLVNYELNSTKLDNILKTNTYYINILKNEINYYIIDKSNKKSYGPYNRVNFDLVRKKLMILKGFQNEKI